MTVGQRTPAIVPPVFNQLRSLLILIEREKEVHTLKEAEGAYMEKWNPGPLKSSDKKPPPLPYIY